MLPLFDSPWAIPFTLLATLVGLLYWYGVSTLDFWKKKGLPYEPPVPFFGNIMDTVLQKRSICLVHQDIYNRFKHKPFVGTFNLRAPSLMIIDPDLIRTILVKDFQHFHDRDINIDTRTNPLAQHLFILSGHKWRVLRNKLSPTFTSGRMKNMYAIMDECSKNLTSYLQTYADGNEILEMKEVLAKFTTDIIGSCAFGLNMNAMSDPDSEFRRMGRNIFTPSLKRQLSVVIAQFVPSIGRLFKLSLLGKEETNFFMSAVKDTTEYRVKHNIQRNDFMQLLINLRYKGKVDDGDEEEHENDSADVKNTKDSLDFEFDDGLMAAQAFVFFIAGFETSSTTMSFALQFLAMNPDIQTKLREEIDASLEENDGKFTYESVMSMKYLEKIVQETLRLYAPVPFLRRQVTVPYKLPGTDVVLEKGTSITIPIYAIHRDPEYYPDPDRFDPERWTEEEKAKRHHYVHLPFGEGPRNCIGMRFGLLQTKLGLATLLSKYEFHVCERTENPIRINPKGLVVSSMTGTVVRITNRT